MTLTRDAEITHYVAGVRAALADLPATQRDELLEDLPAHLAEVAGEGDQPLVMRLGPPEAYAAELRVAAGLAGGPSLPLRARLDVLVGAARGRLPGIDRRLGRVVGQERFVDFLRLLRPAWWVLRGYLAAMAFAAIVSDGDTPIGLLPRAGGSTAVALILLALAIPGSIWLGRQESGFTGHKRLAVGAGTVMLVIGGLVLVADIDGRATETGFGGGEHASDYKPIYHPNGDIEDVYVYDREGNLVTDVRLYDQNGNPIEMGWDSCEPYDDKMPLPSGEQAPTVYPFCPERAPFQVPAFPGDPTVSPTPSDSPTPSPTPSAVPTPSGSAVPSASVSPSQSPS